MALLFELVTSVVVLALKPLLLAKLSCQFGVRIISIIIQTWLEVLRFALCLHFIILWRLAIWFIAVLSLPVRAFAALYRERLKKVFLFFNTLFTFTNWRTANMQLEMQLHRLKNEMENVLWDRKELEEQLHITIKERRMMEMMLMELEEEHEVAIVKIELLEREVQDLKDETQRLKEVQRKALWSYCNIANNDNVGKSSWSPDHYNKNIRQVTKDLCKDDVLKAGSEIYELPQLYIANMISKEGINTLAEQREIALSRSLFSAILSLLVGIVVWEAEDPCMPLLVALFTVVTMSLMSVLQLFTRIEHKPASEAVFLLSFNWFILGTLVCPTLPRIAPFLAPLGLSFLQRTFKWLGL